jgi:D-alanyl-D-alanine endopeptidase (penicillin-binding protein 7)
MRMIKKCLLLSGFMAGLLAAASGADEAPLQLASLGQDDRGNHRTASSPWQALNPRTLQLKSATALVVDRFGNEVYAKQVDTPRPIASITKLMTAMVILDAEQPLEERITITLEDRDRIRNTGSRLGYGATLSREELLRVMLMASENRAASALARSWPGGKREFAQAMNLKAFALGMHDSRFVDPSGLDAGNVASARDLVSLVRAASEYPLIHEATTTRSISVRPWKGRGKLTFSNTNRLLRNGNWEIQLSKTGYIREAGRCLTMQAEIADQPLTIILLNSYGKLTPIGDSNRLRKWIEGGLEG